MPRHGNTRRPDRRKHMGHRMHRRSRLVRVAARRTRPIGAWDPEAWAEKHLLDPAPLSTPLPPVPPGRPARLGRRNKPKPTQKPQKPKRPKGGSK